MTPFAAGLQKVAGRLLPQRDELPAAECIVAKEPGRPETALKPG